MQGGYLNNGIRVGYAPLGQSPIQWRRITQIVSVDGPNVEPREVDITVHGDRFQRTMPGLPGLTNMTVRVMADLDPATNLWLDDILNYESSLAEAHWRIEYATNREMTKFRGREFIGYVSAVRILAGDPGERMLMEVIVKPSTPDFVWDPAAGPSEIP